MDIRQKIKESYVKDAVMRLMTTDEIEKICNKICVPYPGNKKVIDRINTCYRQRARTQLSKIKLYDCMIPVYEQMIINSFLISLYDPGYPIGPVVSDAIGQQAMQALLNTFHQAGANKSGGSDGIKEIIGISKNRKVLYSEAHFRNKNLTMKDVMIMKKNFMKMSIDDLSISILPLKINIPDHIISEDRFPTSMEEGISMYENGIFWWYVFLNTENLYIDKTVSLAKKYGISVNSDVLNSIKVTNVEMMVYRILGFGGQITAVPFSQSFYKWKNWLPKSLKELLP